jgi:hypothetical protein
MKLTKGRNGAGESYTPVVMPNGATLPFETKGGVKVFHLIAEEITDHEFAPGLRCKVWGYNGRSPGPTIEAVEGDRVRIFVTNKLSEITSVHWHGLLLPNGMDGVTAITQPAIKPGETFKYEFTLRQHGTQMYHPHADEMIQIAMGTRNGDRKMRPRPDPKISMLRFSACWARFMPVRRTNKRGTPATDWTVMRDAIRSSVPEVIWRSTSTVAPASR